MCSQGTTISTASYQQLEGHITGLASQVLTQQTKSAPQFEEIMKALAALTANSTKNNPSNRSNNEAGSNATNSNQLASSGTGS